MLRISQLKNNMQTTSWILSTCSWLLLIVMLTISMFTNTEVLVAHNNKVPKLLLFTLCFFINNVAESKLSRIVLRTSFKFLVDKSFCLGLLKHRFINAALRRLCYWCNTAQWEIKSIYSNIYCIYKNHKHYEYI